jgi:hypothetical protein
MSKDKIVQTSTNNVSHNYQPNEEYSINVISQTDSFGKAETIESGAQLVLKLISIINLDANVYSALTQ